MDNDLTTFLESVKAIVAPIARMTEEDFNKLRTLLITIGAEIATIKGGDSIINNNIDTAKLQELEMLQSTLEGVIDLYTKTSTYVQSFNQ